MHRIFSHRQLSAISTINSESDGIGLNQGAGGAGLRIARSYTIIVSPVQENICCEKAAFEI